MITNYTVPGTDVTVPVDDDGDSHCHKPDCQWLSVSPVVRLQVPPALHADPELSGIGVSCTLQVFHHEIPFLFADISGDPWIFHHCIFDTPPSDFPLLRDTRSPKQKIRQSCG